MDNRGQLPFSKFEMISRLIISLLFLFVAIIGYITILYSEDPKLVSFKILLGAILTLWSFKGERVKGFALNLWVMRIGGISLLIVGFYNLLK